MSYEQQGQTWDWHPSVRERAGAQAHFFWRFGFHTIYRAEPTVAAIGEILRVSGVRSYTIHEYFGPLDIVAEGWVPFKDRNTIRNKLSNILNPSQSDLFEVSRTLVDSRWCSGRFDEFSEDTDAKWLSTDVVEALTSGRASPEQIDKYFAAGLIKPVSWPEGVPFMIAISNFAQATDMQRQLLEMKLVELVIERHGRIHDLRLFAGQGFGSHVITGMVPQAALHDELGGLVDAINAKAGLGEFVPVRSFTSIAAHIQPLSVRFGLVVDEALAERSVQPSAEQVSATRIADALGDEESDTLEVKATAFADVKRFVTEGSLVTSKDIERAILETVCAFLNSPTDGTLIIGALERRSPFYDAKAQTWHESLVGFPEYGAYLCVGNELDIEALKKSRGGSINSWDSYQRHLQDVIRRSFDRNPSPWVTVSREVFHGKEFTRVAVRRSTVGWYYLKDDAGRLHVREGNTTQGLVGTAADDYRAAHPRVVGS